MPDDCLFCKIVNHELPSDMLYEDGDYVVFRDIHPKAPVHLLIVPKTHIRSVNDIQPAHTELVGGLFTLAAKMAQKEGINKSGYKLLFNVEKGGGQEIFHLHLHLFGGWKK
ncbi:histidine triad nucleotide-binding protein [Desulfobacter postgatei]|uniref:HIT family hydrolase, diadenosine tetraphosphate hydrolase n=1 Tax=Desulfobacter postgatei 2ac9 TaxID=879212 RepID=I5B3M0_9BACT|nr:histidine triad nucleotide-binding protein [Desulfobacter postgatei]EIM64083.1 HIT family hydrolase, diadenosine tetraphosphate hydrolase [Desulfobacter postgatei 2ac9]